MSTSTQCTPIYPNDPLCPTPVVPPTAGPPVTSCWNAVPNRTDCNEGRDGTNPYATTTTVMIAVKPYCPPGYTDPSCEPQSHALPPPVEAAPATTSAPEMAVRVTEAVDTPTEASVAVQAVSVAQHSAPASLPATGAGGVTAVVVLACGVIALGKFMTRITKRTADA